MKFRFLVVAAAAFGAALMSVVPASAYPAQSTVALNVRSGPSTGYGVVDVLYQGEVVDVRSCSGGWCAITHNGPDGYVSGRYLTQAGNNPPPRQPSPSPQPTNPDIGFCIDAPNFRFGVNCDFDQNNPPNNQPRFAEVCFYEHTNFRGRSVCATPGERARRLGAFNDRISSIRIRGNATAYVCEDINFNGRCANINNSRRNLGPRNNDIISSFRIRR